MRFDVADAVCDVSDAFGISLQSPYSLNKDMLFW